MRHTMISYDIGSVLKLQINILKGIRPRREAGITAAPANQLPDPFEPLLCRSGLRALRRLLATGGAHDQYGKKYKSRDPEQILHQEIVVYVFGKTQKPYLLPTYTGCQRSHQDHRLKDSTLTCLNPKCPAISLP